MQFEVLVSDKDRYKFAELSGDNNPLHTDEEYASKTTYKRCILHGAFASGLLSKMAGVYLPGEKCLLTNMKMKFISPIYTPSVLIVKGVLQKNNPNGGEVQVSILDKETRNLLTLGSYTFLYHRPKKETNKILLNEKEYETLSSNVLVTGATGGLGQSVLSALDKGAIGVSLSGGSNVIKVEDYSNLKSLERFKNISSIVHCASPSPDNLPLTSLDNPNTSINNYISKPLEDVLALSNLLIKNGIEGASLIIVGSSFSSPGRHSWSMPLYSLSKTLVPNLTKILALELSRHKRKIVGVTFEMLDGGMNSNLSLISKQINSDRMLSGQLASMEDAANQIKWIINNPSLLISGSVIDCTGGAIP